VCAAKRERQRPTRGEAREPALRIERIEQRHEVVLVRAATVQQDERADRRAVRAPFEG